MGWTFLMDMDGVLTNEDHLVPGADDFIAELRNNNIPFSVLTNNSIRTARDQHARLLQIGLDIPEESIWTSGMATADFLASQDQGDTAFVIGESGLTTPLYERGFVTTETNPDYVVLGETRMYSFEAITSAIRMIERGSKFIATNPDVTGPSHDGSIPATGAVAAMISKATGREPYYVGKPNPIMMRSALRRLGSHSENTLMIGDRMDTDIIAGLESGMRTILVLTGISTRKSVEKYPYRPTLILDSVNDLVGHTDDPFGDAVTADSST